MPTSATRRSPHSIEEEGGKTVWSTRWGADTVMDLSTGRYIHETVSGSWPTARYQSARCRLQGAGEVNGIAEDLYGKRSRDTLLGRPEERGVDFFTIHAGVLLCALRADDRQALTGALSHAAVQSWRNGASPITKRTSLFEHFREDFVCAADVS